ncbi:hypothetical protein PTTG_08823 [Puccinia triticina 1-1 BBBD Race 1]|uniref:Uncharacterized protein n=2 Tax=Puccinia triticina TaxID=208348 RepID=A0A180GLU9_PUCT1|nr:uncharacterized protein PtA15_3A542 [Puccinia triticina]OAV93474.1 hypothetical protein PTTG_08823 [Puccinia triticina 1-1 BBBD Race 1]WAQ83173.1 hypothetical protein PtA15_3A542 [Puccinia triticina]WAR54018.1 hypothetical protein PtB15_3B528 [Puccinia triticina]
MTLNYKFRSGIRLVSLLAFLLVSGCKPIDLPTSQISAELFAWDEDLVDLDHIFPSGGSSEDGAAGQADDHHQPFSGGHLQPIGLPARPSAKLLADGTLASNGFAAAGASRALDHIFPPAPASEAGTAGQADHSQPSSASHSNPGSLPAGPPSASHHSPLPEFYYPAQMAAKERTVNSQPYHDLDISFDSGELFEPGFLPHDFNTLTEFLGHGTPDADGLTGVRAPQSHHGVAHVSDSHSQTFTGPPPSNLPTFSDYPFVPSSGTTSGPHESPSGKRKQTAGPVDKSIKPQHLPFKPQRKPRIPKLYIPFPESQRPALSKKLPPQGPLGFYLNDFALNNPSEPVEQMEMGPILTRLRAFKLPNDQLVISKSEFHWAHRVFLGFGIIREDIGRTVSVKLSRESAKSHIEDQVQHVKRDRNNYRLANKLVEFVSHYKDWYQHWFDETGIDFEKNLLQPHFIGFEDAAVLFPLYLFYVEMICSIVPREEEVTLEIELLRAQKLFNNWTNNYNDPKSQSNQDLEPIVKALRKKRNLRGALNLHPHLWSYLGIWMITSWRVGVFQQRDRSIPKTVKQFFNNVFYYCYSAHHRRYISRVTVHQPGKIDMLY